MLTVGDGNRPRADRPGLFDGELHAFGGGDMPQAFARVEHGHRGRIALDQRLRPRIDAAVVQRFEIPPERTAAVRVDAPQIGLDQPGRADAGLGLVHAFRSQHADHQFGQRVRLNDDFLRRIGGNVERLGHGRVYFCSGDRCGAAWLTLVLSAANETRTISLSLRANTLFMANAGCDQIVIRRRTSRVGSTSVARLISS